MIEKIETTYLNNKIMFLKCLNNTVYSSVKKEKQILVTCLTIIFKEIITLIICFACFCNEMKDLYG